MKYRLYLSTSSKNTFFAVVIENMRAVDCGCRADGNVACTGDDMRSVTDRQAHGVGASAGDAAVVAGLEHGPG